MKFEDIERIKKQAREIRDIDERIARPKSRRVVIFYKDYRTGYGVNKTDEGEDGGHNERIELIGYRRIKLRELQKSVAKASNWILSLNNPEEEALLIGYYIGGMVHEELAKIMKCEQSTISYKLKAIRNKYKFVEF